jgi:hypothetical protein
LGLGSHCTLVAPHCQLTQIYSSHGVVANGFRVPSAN